MNKLPYVFMLFIGVANAIADQFGGVFFQLPAGWKVEKSPDAIAFSSGTDDPKKAIAIAVGKSIELGGKSFSAWMDEQLKSDLAEGKVVSTSELVKTGAGNSQKLTTARVIESAGTTTLRFYCAVSDGKRAALAIAMCLTEQSATNHTADIRSFFGSLSIGEPSRSVATPAGTKGERVPDSAFVNGVPQGIFVGTSLLSGKAVCLMFLDGGRITRAIPEQGLDNFSWAAHQQERSGDCGSYTLINGILRVRWGDGGVHEGPINQTENGIEFYQKRYSKPVNISLASLAGRWGSARTVGNITVTHELRIDSVGTFSWTTDSGGVVAGRAVHNRSRDIQGKMTIRGVTATFQSKDGKAESWTLLPVKGNPIGAFSIGKDMFTRN